MFSELFGAEQLVILSQIIFIDLVLKLINSSISNFTSYGVAADFGIIYYSPYKLYSFTLVLRNFGTQLKSFDSERENLPFKIALGASYQLEYVPLKWYLTIDNLQKWNISVPNPSEQTIDLEGTITNQNINFFGFCILNCFLKRNNTVS